MQNFDIMSLLPLLSGGGGNKDISSILAAMGKTPPPTPSSNSPPAGNGASKPYPDFSKLYPNPPLSDMPHASAPTSNGGQPDMASMLQLMSAMNSGKKQNSPATPTPDIAPTATQEIRATLRTILDLNALGEAKTSADTTKKRGS